MDQSADVTLVIGTEPGAGSFSISHLPLIIDHCLRQLATTAKGGYRGKKMTE
jgi:hypothetical protein